MHRSQRIGLYPLHELQAGQKEGYRRKNAANDDWVVSLIEPCLLEPLRRSRNDSMEEERYESGVGKRSPRWVSTSSGWAGRGRQRLKRKSDYGCPPRR